MSDYAAIEKEARIFTEECVTNNRIDPELFAQYDIKRGLRDKNGKGVLAGITNISRIDAFEERDGQKIPCEGKLWRPARQALRLRGGGLPAFAG